MGSYSITCSITGIPFNYSNNEAIIIPIILKPLKEMKIDISDSAKVFPFYMKGEYSDYGHFELIENDISNKLLDFIKSMFVSTSVSLDSVDAKYINDITWNEFFELSLDGKLLLQNGNRLTFFAIHKPLSNQF